MHEKFSQYKAHTKLPRHYPNVQKFSGTEHTASKGPISKTFTPPSKSRWWRWVLGASLLVFCLFSLDLEQVLPTLQQMSIPWLMVALTMWTGDRFLMAWKWGVLLRALGVSIPFAKLIRIYYQGTASGIFLPSSLGGDLLRAYLVSRSAGATHDAYASLLMEKIMGLLSAINWAILGTVVYTYRVWDKAVTGWIWTGLVAFLLLYGLFFLSLQPRYAVFVRYCLTRFPKYRLLTFFERLVEAYARYTEQHRALGWTFVLTTAEHGLQLLIVFVIAQCLGIDADTTLFLAVTTIYMFIYRLPIAPDGWGVGEIAAIGVYGLIGVSYEQGFSLALLSHVLQTIVALPGFWFLAQFRREELSPLKSGHLLYSDE